MSECSISIVIPAYNVENYLGAALDSIKAQGEAPDELIVIDDGSDDRTLEVANSYEFPFSYTVLSSENQGQGNARNIGIGVASSEYIYFFDSDDVLSESFVSSIKREIVAREFPDIILFSGESFRDPGYEGARRISYKRGFAGVFRSREIFLDNGAENNGLFCSPCLYVSRRALWGKGRMEFGPDYYEDEVVFYPLLFRCESFVVMDEVLFYRRYREGSTMTIQLNQRHVEGALNCLRATLGIFQRQDLASREKWHILKRLRFNVVWYIRQARRAGASISYKEILKAVWLTKDIQLAATVALCFTRADELELVKSAARFVQRIGSGRNEI